MLLINPYGQKLSDFYRYLPISPHIGIGILAAYLLQEGKTVRILDENVEYINEKNIDNYLKELHPPYIFGISCVTAAAKRGYELAKILKNKYPDAKIIFGGVHPTVLPEEVLKTNYVDIVVRGEAEITLSKLYNIIKSNQDYSALPGLSFKTNNGIRHNPSAPLISDLNTLPLFPYDLFKKISSRYSLGFIVSSRGCPYDCIFCSQRLISGRIYRYTSSNRVIEEMDILINKYKQQHIIFSDDNFLANKERIHLLCELIIKKGFHQKCSFQFQARGDSVDSGILKNIKKANFKSINLGIETASERLMKLLNKRETVQENIDAVILAKKLGFQVTATFILGLPTETKEERLAAYRLAKKLDIDFVRFNNATPYPGTKLFEMAKNEGTLNIDKDWSNLNACGSLVNGYFSKTRLAYVPAGTNEKELKKYIFKANALFYLRPKTLLRIIRNKNSPAGWFILPKGWFYKPKEWYYVIRILCGLLIRKNK